MEVREGQQPGVEKMKFGKVVPWSRSSEEMLGICSRERASWSSVKIGTMFGGATSADRATGITVGASDGSTSRARASSANVTRGGAERSPIRFPRSGAQPRRIHASFRPAHCVRAARWPGQRYPSLRSMPQRKSTRGRCLRPGQRSYQAIRASERMAEYGRAEGAADQSRTRDNLARKVLRHV